MMYGSDLGTLNIYNQPVSGALGQPIWTISGDLGRGQTWLKGQVDLNSNSSFNVSFILGISGGKELFQYLMLFGYGIRASKMLSAANTSSSLDTNTVGLSETEQFVRLDRLR